MQFMFEGRRVFVICWMEILSWVVALGDMFDQNTDEAQGNVVGENYISTVKKMLMLTNILIKVEQNLFVGISASILSEIKCNVMLKQNCWNRSIPATHIGMFLFKNVHAGWPYHAPSFLNWSKLFLTLVRKVDFELSSKKTLNCFPFSSFLIISQMF